jgi:hypothetical protein
MEIASVRYLNQYGAGELDMGLAKAAVKRTALFNFSVAKVRMHWRFGSLPTRHGRFTAPKDSFKGSVLGAFLDKKDLVILKQARGADLFKADRTQAFGFIRV